MQLPIDPYLGLFKVSLPDSPCFKGSENNGERFPKNLESINRNSYNASFSRYLSYFLIQIK
jgi:hypothetical protein